jgi:hypothetical protein
VSAGTVVVVVVVVVVLFDSLLHLREELLGKKVMNDLFAEFTDSAV